jgi:hypothetical protein
MIDNLKLRLSVLQDYCEYESSGVKQRNKQYVKQILTGLWIELELLKKKINDNRIIKTN